MTKKTLNVGIVGYGFMGRTHANAYRNVGTFFDVPLQPVLKAACGRDAAKVKAYADNWGFESTESDWRRLLERKDIGQKTLGDVLQIKGDVMKAAEQRFTPEFRNRIDEIVIFSPLTLDEVREIAKLYLAKIQKNMERQGKIVEVTDAALDLLTEKGFSPAYGARFLKRHIDQKVKLPITNDWKASIKFTVDAVDGEIRVIHGEVLSLN